MPPLARTWFLPPAVPLLHGVPGSTHAGTLVTTPLAHGVALIPGVSLIHGGAFVLGVALGDSSTHGVSLVHGGSLITGVSSTLGVSSIHGGSVTHGVVHGVSLTPFTTHTGTFTLGILATSRAPGVSIPPKLRVHPFAALIPSTPRGTTEPTWS